MWYDDTAKKGYDWSFYDGNNGNASGNSNQNSDYDDDEEDYTPSDKGSGSGSSAATGDVYEAIDLINAERVKAKLPELEIDSELMAMAAVRASEQPVASGHTRPDGSDWKTIFDEFEIELPNKRGENAASGFPSASGVVDAWMNSSGHKANILKDNVTKIGVGYDNSAYRSTLRGHWVMIVTN